MDKELSGLLDELKLFVNEHVKTSEEIQRTLVQLRKRGVFDIEITIRPIRVDKTKACLLPNGLDKRYVQ